MMQDKLNVDIQDIQQEFESIQDYERLSSHLEAGKRTEHLDERIDETIHEANVCNRREKLFSQPVTDFSGLL